MFIVERRYLLQMTATTDGGDVILVPWTSEEPVQNLSCWIYSPDQGSECPQQGGLATGTTPTNLGGGNAQIFRGGVGLGTATTFPSAPSLCLPADIITVGSDTTFETLEPQTSESGGTLGRLQGIYSYNGTKLVYDNSSQAFKTTRIAPFSTYVKVVNLDSTPKSVIVHWIGLAWRNT
jgi:hypothetical protein